MGANQPGYRSALTAPAGERPSTRRRRRRWPWRGRSNAKRGLAATLLAEHGAEVAGEPTEALDAAQAAAREAEHELATFAGDVGARKVLGEAAWRGALEARARARDEAEGALTELLAATRPARFGSAVAITTMPADQLAPVLRDVFAGLWLDKGRGDLRRRLRFTPGPLLGEALAGWAHREFPGQVVKPGSRKAPVAEDTGGPIDRAEVEAAREAFAALERERA